MPERIGIDDLGASDRFLARLLAGDIVEHPVLAARAREEEALYMGASGGAREIELLARLDAFDDDGDAQAFRQRGGCRHDLAALVIIGRVRGEAAIELDRVDRKSLEVLQRRIAGAEIVERELDAGVAQEPQLLDHLARRDQRRGFGDFELQPLRRQAGPRQRVERLRGEIAGK